MVKQIRNIITENERNDIRLMHNLDSISNVAITNWLSPDEKYCIFLDELYDIENKLKIGNVFENFDNFKFFLKHSFEVAENIPQQIKEEVLESINSLILTENNQNFNIIKPYVKQLLKEGWLEDKWNQAKSVGSDVVNWGKEKVKDAYQGTKDFVKGSVEGLKKAYSYISDGDWAKAIALIGKGALWVARKIRSALYHPVGLILDAILVASGIGKTAQFVIWAVVVALDIYELTTGDYEDPSLSMGWRLLFFGVDLIGLVFAGAAAKGVKTVVQSALKRFGSSAEGLTKAVRETPVLKSATEKMLNASKSANGFMGRASTYLQKNAPKIYSFFSGAIKGLGSILTKMINVISGALGVGFKAISAPGKIASKSLGGGRVGKMGQAGLNTTALLYGTEKLMHNKGGGENQQTAGIDFSNVDIDFSKGL